MIYKQVTDEFNLIDCWTFSFTADILTEMFFYILW